MNLNLGTEVKNKLSEIARQSDLQLEKACEIILSQFALNEGGRIYTGLSKKSEGTMFIVQWPFLPGLVKFEKEEISKIEMK